MNYTNCPICNRKVSIKTIERVGRCNDCNCNLQIQALLESAESNELCAEPWKNNYIIEFYEFIDRSYLGKIWKYRAIIDFRILLKTKVSDHFDEVYVYEEFYKVSSYKSPRSLECICIFLYSKGSITFNLPLHIWAKAKLKNSFYYKPTITSYYFDKTKCADCGKSIRDQHHRFCDVCKGRRSLIQLCERVSQKKSFNNENVSDLFKSYLNFLFDSHLSYGYISKTSEIQLLIFQKLDKDVDALATSKIVSISRNDYAAIITHQWIVDVFESMPIENFSTSKMKMISPCMGHLVGFFEKYGLVERDSFNPEIAIIRGKVVVNETGTSVYQQISSRIDIVPKGYQKLLRNYLEIRSKKNETLERKNAIKSLKWKSIYDEFGTVFSLVSWLIDHECVEEWTIVSQDMINRHLLTVTNQQARDIRKRKLYNFFEFGKRNRFFTENPIPPFQSRNFVISERVFTRANHRELYLSIRQSSKTNPTDALLTCLSYYQVLQSNQISSIEMSDIDLSRKCIHIQGRAPSYLSDEEMHYLEKHLELVYKDRVHYLTPYLFFLIHKGRANKVHKKWVQTHVKRVYWANPSTLRRAGLQYCAEKFGPQFLHDCFGVSISHIGRFGNVDDWIVEQIVNETQ